MKFLAIETPSVCEASPGLPSSGSVSLFSVRETPLPDGTESGIPVLLAIFQGSRNETLNVGDLSIRVVCIRVYKNLGRRKSFLKKSRWNDARIMFNHEGKERNSIGEKSGRTIPRITPDSVDDG